MVAAVRCPNPKCRKFMLVEDADQGNVVPCLICKQPVKVPTAGAAPVKAPPPAPAVSVPPPGEGDLMPIFDDDPPPEPQFKLD
jgi:hypothetical protein